MDGRRQRGLQRELQSVLAIAATARIIDICSTQSLIVIANAGLAPTSCPDAASSLATSNRYFTGRGADGGRSSCFLFPPATRPGAAAAHWLVYRVPCVAHAGDLASDWPLRRPQRSTRITLRVRLPTREPATQRRIAICWDGRPTAQLRLPYLAEVAAAVGQAGGCRPGAGKLVIDMPRTSSVGFGAGEAQERCREQ